MKYKMGAKRPKCLVFYIGLRNILIIIRNTGALMRSATAAVPKMIVNTTRRAMDGLRKQSQSTLR